MWSCKKLLWLGPYWGWGASLFLLPGPKYGTSSWHKTQQGRDVTEAFVLVPLALGFINDSDLSSCRRAGCSDQPFFAVSGPLLITVCGTQTFYFSNTLRRGKKEMLLAVALKPAWHLPTLSTRPASSKEYSSLAGSPRTCLNTAVILQHQQESVWRQPCFHLWTGEPRGVLSRERGPETKGNLKWQGSGGLWPCIKSPCWQWQQGWGICSWQPGLYSHHFPQPSHFNLTSPRPWSDLFLFCQVGRLNSLWGAWKEKRPPLWLRCSTPQGTRGLGSEKLLEFFNLGLKSSLEIFPDSSMSFL